MIRQAIEKVVELANAKENAQLEQAEIKGMLHTKFGPKPTLTPYSRAPS